MTSTPQPVSSTSITSEGGFIPLPPLSPPPSSVHSSSITGTTLPRPRTHALPPASPKESSFIRYVDAGIRHITRRYAKKFTSLDTPTSSVDTDTDDAAGYTRFPDVASDLSRLVDVVWVSGTPSLQSQYLLQLALLVVTYLPAFPAAPGPTFRLLRKLDLAFSSLLQGRDPDTGEVLPGFERGGLSTTDKVRIRGVVQRTRVVVVEVMGKEEREGKGEVDGREEREGESMDDTEEEDGDSVHGLENEDEWDMEIARAYDRTLVELGGSLGGEG